MPSFANMVASALAIGAVGGSAMAMPTQRIVEIDGQNITVTAGRHDPNDPKRAIPPTECAFQGSRVTFGWQRYTGFADGGTACFGWKEPQCKTEPYDEPHFGDIQAVMGEQVTKDGQFEGSEVGEWTANFLLGTTAFSNRDYSAFELGFVTSGDGKAWNTYYWSRDGDYAQVTHKGFYACP